MLKFSDEDINENINSNIDSVERSRITLKRSTIYFSQILLYSENSRKLIKRMIEDIEEFVRNEREINAVSNPIFIGKPS